ncbi:hypothetical protein MHH81_07935 [Psychrobacillus sp. FSL H8-0484]|uniref:hypothetical protein n=1 Tax=Psychrobacillus sp. FSL H8-0484 TaxID=2921390 RepID=UPI0030F9DF60
MSIGMIAVILIFSVPIIKLVLAHLEEKAKIKAKGLENELELEKLKYENFVIETEKMKLQLEQMRLESPKEEFHQLLK